MLPPLQHRHAPNQHDSDAAVRQTDSDAALARLSAVQKHYLDDHFIRHFVPRAHLQPPRPPLINIGTYVRAEGIDELVDQWLELAEQEGTQCQIVSLGAGSDTRYWRIATGKRKESLKAYFEFDFPEVTTKKAMAIRKSKELSAVLGRPEDVKLTNGGTSLHAPVYHLLSTDLRLPPSEALTSLLAAPSSAASDSSHPLLSPNHPTLLLFECVLVYMPLAASSALIEWFVDYFSKPLPDGENSCGILGGIVYEMFGLGDAFGKVMRDNLKARNVSLPGVDPFPMLASLPGRFLQHGFTTAKALTLREIRRAHISPSEQERIAHLEMLDEVEELELVLEHYAITWGVKLPSDSKSFEAQWETWGLRPKEQTQDYVD
ncbi:hypothetical protein AcW1_003480 [Taiwanofungus camphoratus]|nr:hypothetical protein AcW1_003480 [Antrodia cinnamomea]